MSLQFYIVDTETTGLNSEVHDIIQISVIRAEDKMQLSRNLKAVNPHMASPQALAITNKTHEDLLLGMDHTAAVELFDNFLKEDGLTPKHRVLIAHNAQFDRKFLQKLWANNKKELPCNMWLCTMGMMKEYIKKNGIPNEKVNLKNSMQLLKVGTSTRAHTASGDTINTFLVWEKLMQSGVDYVNLIKSYPHSLNENNDMDNFA